MALFSATFGALASIMTLAAGTAAVGASIASSAGAFTPKQKMPEAPAPLPEPPKTVVEPAKEVIAKSEQKAQAIVQEKQTAVRRSRSVYSSPLGLTGEATTTRKTLLGQ